MSTLSHLTDLVARSRTRVLTQYRDMTARFLPLLDLFNQQAQDLEDAFWALLQAHLLDTATDTWLERIGAMVGETRQASTDVQYRYRIRARVVANRSSGTVEELFEIIRLMLFGATATIITREWTLGVSPAAIEIRIEDWAAYPDGLPLKGTHHHRLLKLARAAGVTLMVHTWPTANKSLLFSMGDGNGHAPDADGATFGTTASPAIGGIFVSAIRD